MIVEIITTGTELLLGEIIDTNSVYLARKLNELGFDVFYHSTVGDNRERMANAVKIAMQRADIIITTGGLGPTQGDITKEVTAEVLNRKLMLHEESLRNIKCFFSHQKRDMPHNNRKQAMIPEGAVAVYNTCGTAPGVIIDDGDKIIINLPGPPKELETMFATSIMPYFKEKFGTQGTIYSKIILTYGIGESLLAERLKDIIKVQSNPTIALLARKNGIIIRLTAKANNVNSAAEMIKDVEHIIRQRVGENIYGTDKDTLEAVTGQLLKENKITLSLAESCTGGLVSNLLTDIPGSSEYLIGSVVCYSNQIKINQVGVKEQTLKQFGAVSEQTAIEMAEGIKKRFNTNIGVGITGIAGPGGATSEKPVGLVYIAIAGTNSIKCFKHNFVGSRTDIKYRTALTSLNYIRHYFNSLID